MGSPENLIASSDPWIEIPNTIGKTSNYMKDDFAAEKSEDETSRKRNLENHKINQCLNSRAKFIPNGIIEQPPKDANSSVKLIYDKNLSSVRFEKKGKLEGEVEVGITKDGIKVNKVNKSSGDNDRIAELMELIEIYENSSANELDTTNSITQKKANSKQSSESSKEISKQDIYKFSGNDMVTGNIGVTKKKETRKKKLDWLIKTRKSTQEVNHIKDYSDLEINQSHTKAEKDTKSEITYIINHKRVLIYCIGLSIGGFPLGWDVGTTGRLVSHSSFQELFGGSTSLMTGIIISCFNIGCMIGCVTVSQFSMNLKDLLRISSLIYFVGTGMEILACYQRWNVWVFITGRLICGICCGSSCVITPMYIHDLTIDSAKKSFNLSLFQTCICICILLGNIINYAYENASWSFLIVNYFKIGYFIVINGVLCIIPDSLSHFLGRKSYTKLEGILMRLFVNCDRDLITTMILDYEKNQSDSPNKSWLWIFDKHNYKKTLKCCCLMGFQQLTGINYYFYYGNVLFNSSYATICLSFVNLTGALASCKIISKFCARKILIIGSILMSIVMATYAILGNFSGPNKTQINNTLIVITCFFILCFAITWGPCSGVLNTIISENKSPIIGLSVSVNWVLNFVVSIITPSMINLFHFNYGFFFCLNLIIMGLFCIYCL